MPSFTPSFLSFLCFAVLLHAQPANDAFQNRTVLSGTFVAWNGTLLGATAEPGEPGSGTVTAAASVWYEWRAPLSGEVAMEFTAVEFAGAIGVFQGTNLNQLISIANAISPDPIRFHARGGEAYQIVIDTSSGFTGGFSVQLLLAPTAPNDNFAKAARLSGFSGWAQGSNTASSVEAGEPRHLGTNGPSGRSVWWAWTAPDHGSWRVDGTTLPANTSLAIYTGLNVSNLTCLASNRLTSALNVRVTRGSEYFIAVDHTNDALIEFSYLLSPAPVNDFFTNRLTLIGNTGAVVATTVNASTEPGEPLPPFTTPPTLWWTWTAPSASPMNIRFTDETHTLECYTNNTLGSLRQLTGLDFAFQGSGRYVMANVRPGGTYQFRARANSAPGPFSFVWYQTSALVPNDHLVNRAVLHGTNITVSGSLIGASREAGEPIHGGSSGMGSLWYGWRAPANGSIRFALTNSAFNTVAAWYRGTNYGGLTQLAAVDTFATPAAGFNILAGVDYSMAVDNSSFGDLFQFLVSYASAPTNDHFTNGITLVGENVTSSGSTAGAGKDVGEPNHAGSTSRTGTIWYRWQTTAGGPVTILAEGPMIDPVLGVYTGNQVSALTTIASNNDYLNNGLRDSRVTFNAVAGTLYHIAVATTLIAPGEVTVRIQRAAPPSVVWSQPATDLVLPAGIDVELLADATDSDGTVTQVQVTRSGQVIATLTTPPYLISEANLPFGSHNYRAFATDNDGLIGQTPTRQIRVAPANDFFTNRFLIPQDTLSVTGTLSGTTRDANEPRQLSTAQRLAWWSWTSPSNGVVYLSISNASSRAVSAYTGSALNTLALAATSANARYATLSVEAGTEYHIAGESSLDGDIMLSFTPPPFAANDHFTNAIAISDTNALVTALNTEGTSEPGEPRHGGWNPGRSLWWTWTAPTNGAVLLKTAGSAFDTTLGVYTGTSVSNLALVVSNRTSSFSGNSAVTFTANAGTIYRIAVDAYSGFGGVVLSLEFFSVPGNDLFGQRIPLVGRTNHVFGNNIAAGPRETGEPNPTIFGAGKTLWWSWTAPAPGLVLFSGENSAMRNAIGVFTGNILPSLSTVTSAVNIISPTNRGQFNAIAGTTYQFQLDSFYTTPAGALGLSILQPHTTLNDSFADRIPLTGYVGDVTGDNFNATRETGEPVHSAFQSGTVWWTWTAPETRSVSVVLDEAMESKPGIAVYEGASLGTLSLIASNYPPGSAARAATFNAVAGTAYQLAFFQSAGPMGPIRFSIVPNELPVVQLTSPASGAVFYPGEEIPVSANAADPDGTIAQVDFSTAGIFRTDTSLPFSRSFTNLPLGEYVLTTRATDNLGAFTFAPPVAFRVAPLNDNFANAILIETPVVQLLASNGGAALEPGEPNHASGGGSRSIWFSWTAPAAGRFAFSTEGSSFDTLLGIYTGSSVSNLTLIAANDNRSAFDTWSEAPFVATAGTTYYVAIASRSAESGTAQLTLHHVADNDLFSNATPLRGHATVRTHNAGAGEETDEALHSVPAGSSLWWTWTAPADGRYLATTAGSDFDTVLGIFAGPAIPNLTLIAADDDGTRRNGVVRFDAVAGQQFFLVVSGYGAAEGNVRLTIAPGGAPTLFEPSKVGATNFAFGMLAEPGTTNTAQRSSTLTNWNSFRTIVATDWWTEIQDPSTNGLMFYRVTQP